MASKYSQGFRSKLNYDDDFKSSITNPYKMYLTPTKSDDDFESKNLTRNNGYTTETTRRKIIDPKYPKTEKIIETKIIRNSHDFPSDAKFRDHDHHRKSSSQKLDGYDDYQDSPGTKVVRRESFKYTRNGEPTVEKVIVTKTSNRRSGDYDDEFNYNDKNHHKSDRNVRRKSLKDYEPESYRASDSKYREPSVGRIIVTKKPSYDANDYKKSSNDSSSKSYNKSKVNDSDKFNFKNKYLTRQSSANGYNEPVELENSSFKNHRKFLSGNSFKNDSDNSKDSYKDSNGKVSRKSRVSDDLEYKTSGVNPSKYSSRKITGYDDSSLERKSRKNDSKDSTLRRKSNIDDSYRRSTEINDYDPKYDKYTSRKSSSNLDNKSYFKKPSKDDYYYEGSLKKSSSDDSYTKSNLKSRYDDYDYKKYDSKPERKSSNVKFDSYGNGYMEPVETSRIVIEAPKYSKKGNPEPMFEKVIVTKTKIGSDDKYRKKKETFDDPSKYVPRKYSSQKQTIHFGDEGEDFDEEPPRRSQSLSRPEKLTNFGSNNTQVIRIKSDYSDSVKTDPKYDRSRSKDRQPRGRRPGVTRNVSFSLINGDPPPRQEWEYNNRGVVITEMIEGVPCDTCELCRGFETHDWRKTCQACKCPRESHALYHEEWVSVRERLGFRLESQDQKVKDDAKSLGYSWIPPGLPKSKVDGYFRSFPAEKVPKISSPGDVYRDRQITVQLPKQDLASNYCKFVPEEHKSSYEDFIQARNEIALDIGHVKECTINTDCRTCQKPITIGSLAVVAPKFGDSILWHPSCFSCKTCDEILVDLTYCVHDDNIYCERHYAENLKPRCHGCDEVSDIFLFIFKLPHIVAITNEYSRCIRIMYIPTKRICVTL